MSKEFKIVSEEEALNELPDNLHYVKWGVGNRVDDYIFLHEELRKPEWEELHDWILNHEIGHGASLSMDIKMDTWMPLKQWVKTELFMWKNLHKGTWWQMSPIRIVKLPQEKEKTILFDWKRLMWIGVTGGLLYWITGMLGVI